MDEQLIKRLARWVVSMCASLAFTGFFIWILRFSVSSLTEAALIYVVFWVVMWDRREISRQMDKAEGELDE